MVLERNVSAGQPRPQGPAAPAWAELRPRLAAALRSGAAARAPYDAAAPALRQRCGPTLTSSPHAQNTGLETLAFSNSYLFSGR